MSRFDGGSFLNNRAKNPVLVGERDFYFLLLNFNASYFFTLIHLISALNTYFIEYIEYVVNLGVLLFLS